MNKVIQRTFIPGSEWIYIKVYTGSNTADKILINELAKYISILNKKKYIKKWFFIRYSDPDFHLRIRILVNDSMLVGETIQIFYKYFYKLVDDNRVWRIQLDTYNRELERYKSHLMELTESMFCIDSNYTLKLLNILEGMSQIDRCLIAVKMVDALLADFNCDLQQKKELLESMDRSYKIEFGFNEFNVKQLNQMYREYSCDLEEVLDGKKTDKGYEKLYHILTLRSKALRMVVTQLVEADKMKEISMLLSSYIHMMLIRLFRSKNRLYELVIYNFMNRLYTSKIARMKYLNNAKD